MKNIEEIKKVVGRKAVEFVEDGMRVGLGTGSTAYWFIESLIEKHRQGLKVVVAASSEASLIQAKKGGLPLIEMESLSYLDLTVDGADEIDSEKRMIKGGGGALLREKILASMSKEMIVVVDETKVTSKLGAKKLPVEIIPFGYKSTIRCLNERGFLGSIRRSREGELYKTDNGNYLYDIQLDVNRLKLPDDHEQILRVPGVVDTGFFLGLAGRVIIGFLDGSIKVI